MTSGRPRTNNYYVHPICERLRLTRTVKQIPREQLALKAGYESVTLARWENGEISPSLVKLINWAEALDFNLSVTLTAKDVADV